MILSVLGSQIVSGRVVRELELSKSYNLGWSCRAITALELSCAQAIYLVFPDSLQVC
jgi:hypothetical protein